MKYIIYVKALYDLVYGAEAETPEQALLQVSSGEAVQMGAPVLTTVLPQDHWIIEPASIPNALSGLSKALTNLLAFTYANGVTDYDNQVLTQAKIALVEAKTAIEESKQIAEEIENSG
jgi:hypothetical protein